MSNSKAHDVTCVDEGAVTVVVTGTVIAVAAGVAVAAIGAAVVPVVAMFIGTVVGPNATRCVAVLAIGAGASGGFPTLHIARLDCRAISNFALFEFDRPKGTLGAATTSAEGVVVTFVSRIMQRITPR